MKQFISIDKFFIQGSFAEVIKQLKELSAQFKTVKELLDYYKQYNS